MGFAIIGSALVASYELARFAFSLFVPSMSAELALRSYLVGIIGALPFVIFVLVRRRDYRGGADRCVSV